jgi:dipeptidase D
LGRVLDCASEAAPIRLAELGGGVSRNAIPREATAVIAIANGDDEQVRAAIRSGHGALRAEHASTDAGLTVTVAPGSAELAGSAEATARALDVLRAMPCGVVSLAPGREDVVQTSTSLTVARTEDGVLTLASMARSSSAAELEQVVSSFERLAARYDVELEVHRSYRPWEPDLDSGLLTTAGGAYRRLFGSDPRLEVVHGGLECAVIGEKLPGVQMISLGPTILGPHAPGERVSVSGAERAYRLLSTLLDDLSS